MIQKFLLLIIAAIIGVCMFIVLYWKIIIAVVVICIIVAAIYIYFLRNEEVNGNMHEYVKESFNPRSSHVGHGKNREIVKECRCMDYAKNNDCEFFDKISEKCMLKNGYLGCRWRDGGTSYLPYRPVNVRTYVKKNGTTVHSHGRSRKSK